MLLKLDQNLFVDVNLILEDGEDCVTLEGGKHCLLIDLGDLLTTLQR